MPKSVATCYRQIFKFSYKSTFSPAWKGYWVTRNRQPKEISPCFEKNIDIQPYNGWKSERISLQIEGSSGCIHFYEPVVQFLYFSDIPFHWLHPTNFYFQSFSHEANRITLSYISPFLPLTYLSLFSASIHSQIEYNFYGLCMHKCTYWGVHWNCNFPHMLLCKSMLYLFKGVFCKCVTDGCCIMSISGDVEKGRK